MPILNDKNAITEQVIHIMITNKCNRNCKYCCNKMYSIEDIPYVTIEELKNAHTICLTGGEPFAYADLSMVACFLKKTFPNIQKIYVYTNAVELCEYLIHTIDDNMGYIDGLNVSIKNKDDLEAFDVLHYDSAIMKMKNNRLYVFEDLMHSNTGGFEVIKREWQKEFTPASDSIFRKMF